MRESLIDSIRILWALISPFIYFAIYWSYSFGGLVIEPLTCPMNSFYMRIKFVLFFHARKFDAPNSLLLPMKNEVILIVYSDIDIRILTCQVNIILWWRYIQLDSFLIFMMMDDACFLEDDNTSFARDVVLQTSLRCCLFFNVREITLKFFMMMEMLLLASLECGDFPRYLKWRFHILLSGGRVLLEWGIF